MKQRIADCYESNQKEHGFPTEAQQTQCHSSQEGVQVAGSDRGVLRVKHMAKNYGQRVATQ